MPLYHSFVELFQTESPLVHVLYEKLCRLVYTMMGRYVKASIYQNKTGKDLQEIKHSDIQNHLSDKDLLTGNKGSLRKARFWKQKRALLDVRKFLRTRVSYLLSHFPFDYELLQVLGSLQT